MTGTIRWYAALFSITACGVSGTPVPVRGDLAPLVGEWVGEYSSAEAGRTGSIVFTLAAGRDTALGDVMMVPANIEAAPTSRSDDPMVRTPRILKISFVRCEGTAVTGWLEAYPDPDTGEKTSTTFDGTIKGNRLEGTFVSYLELSNKRRTGKWVVNRKKAP